MAEAPGGARDALAEEILERFQGGLRVAGLYVVGAVHVVIGLPRLLGKLSGYDHPWVQLAFYGLLTVVILASAHVEWSGRAPSRRWVAPTLLVTLAGSAVATAQLPAQEFLHQPTWSFLTVGWLGVLLLIGRGAVQVGAFFACHLAISLCHLLFAGVPSTATAAGLAAPVLGLCGMQLGIVLSVRMLERSAAAASAAIRAEERRRTSAALAWHLHTDQRERRHSLEGSVLPLLSGLADGSRDPQDEAVRHACAVAAARLRRDFAERDGAADPLLHEVHACVDVAERRGVQVRLAVRGGPVPVPPPLRRALLEPILTTLTASRASARVTVVRAGGRVRIGVVVDDPRAPVTESTEAGVRVRAVRGTHELWVEVSCAVPDRREAEVRCEDAGAGPRARGSARSAGPAACRSTGAARSDGRGRETLRG